MRPLIKFNPETVENLTHKQQQIKPKNKENLPKNNKFNLQTAASQAQNQQKITLNMAANQTKKQ